MKPCQKLHPLIKHVGDIATWKRSVLLGLVLVLSILTTRAQQDVFSGQLNPRDSTLWFRIEDLDFQAGELEYRRDSLLRVRRQMEAREDFPGKRDSIRSILRRALQLHLEAIEKQQRSNEMLGLIYRNQLQELETVKFWYVGDKKVMQAQGLYSDARELQAEADSLRKIAENRVIDLAEKASQLDNALRREERALRKMSQAWQIFHNVTGGVKNVLKATLEPNPVIGKKKVISEDALAMISQPVDRREALHSGSEDSLATASGTVSPSGSRTVYSVSEEPPALESQTGLHYRVQIAESSSPLPTLRLDSIYPGRKNILLLEEEGLYRYMIGHCPTYHHADSLRKYINISGASVVAYRDQKRLDAGANQTSPDQCPPLRMTEGLPADSGLVYSVQVAASQNRMTPGQLKYIYCGNLPVYVSWEKPFYRYLVGSFDNYRAASRLQSTVCVPGTFVVAYRNGQRINIREAMAISREP